MVFSLISLMIGIFDLLFPPPKKGDSGQSQDSNCIYNIQVYINFSDKASVYLALSPLFLQIDNVLYIKLFFNLFTQSYLQAERQPVSAYARFYKDRLRLRMSLSQECTLTAQNLTEMNRVELSGRDSGS